MGRWATGLFLYHFQMVTHPFCGCSAFEIFIKVLTRVSLFYTFVICFEETFLDFKTIKFVFFWVGLTKIQTKWSLFASGYSVSSTDGSFDDDESLLELQFFCSVAFLFKGGKQS